MAPKIFPDSSFFRRHQKLPTPSEVRAENDRSSNVRAQNFNRPPPVRFPSMGLLIKYGGDVTVAEAETQLAVYKKLIGQVPVPEVFGWDEDDGQTFIYMALIPGQTLEERWSSMDESERQGVCRELQHMVAAWRALKQESNNPYIGQSACRQAFSMSSGSI
jgi:hypothetical protein